MGVVLVFRVAAGMSVLLGTVCAFASPSGELKKLSIKERQALAATSVPNHPERLADAPASIFVITPEAIRRSGATTLPEALRLAPNLLVAQTGAASYSISARGFNIPDALA